MKKSSLEVNAIKSNRPRQPRVRFQDAEELKMQLHRTIHEGKVSYDVETLYWDTGIAQRIARSSTFQCLDMKLFTRRDPVEILCWHHRPGTSRSL